MQKYFLHKDGRQVGPYTKEDLAQIRITRDTMLWFDGLVDWQEAGTIEELADLFRNQPPPFIPKNDTQPPHRDPQEKPRDMGKKNAELLKKSSLIYAAIGVVVIGMVAFILNENQKAKANQLQEKLKTQQEQIEQQRNQQQALEDAQQRAEEERIAAEERQKQYDKVNRRYAIAVNNLKEAQIKLDKIQEFHFLRTFSEKEAQIENQLKVVESWENEVDRLKNELSQF